MAFTDTRLLVAPETLSAGRAPLAAWNAAFGLFWRTTPRRAPQTCLVQDRLRDNNEVAMRGHGRKRFVALGTVLSSMLLSCPCALALNPALDVSQYSHMVWKIRDGFSQGTIGAIAQTPDGYLWLGTEFGLLRFDGIRNVRWQPPPDQHLRSDHITRLLAGRDGTLWIGTTSGLARWKNGILTQYAELAGSVILALLEDHKGSIWAGAIGVPNGELCEIQEENIHCYGRDGRFGVGVSALAEDGKGNLWAGVRTGVWRWKPDPSQFIALPGAPSNTFLGQGDDGTILVGRYDGIRRLAEGKTEAYGLPGVSGSFDARKFFRDRDGGLWIATLNRGLLHVHQGRTDVFARSDGLSGNAVTAIFEDHEGNVWVSTLVGLDRFRDSAVTTFSADQGLPEVDSASVLASEDGNIWLGSGVGLRKWHPGEVTSYGSSERREQAPHQRNVREIAGSGLPNEPVGGLFEDRRGRIWVATRGGVGYLENDRLVSIGAVPGGFVNSMAQDNAGNLWIANQDHGLLRLSPDHEVQQIPWVTLGHKDHAYAMAADSFQGGVWLGFFGGGITWFRDGQVRASYSRTEGLPEGRVNDLRFDRDGALWASTAGGLGRLTKGRVSALTSRNGLPCDAVQWTVEDDAGSVWLNMPCGLVRVVRSELDAWSAAGDKAGVTIHARVFDSSDGVRSVADQGTLTPHVAKSADGKLWFTTMDGLSMVDPHRIPVNGLPPPVDIEKITADRKQYWENLPGDRPSNPHLPPLVRDVTIDYTALSFAAPEKMNFRYKLEGHDSEWTDVGNRRQAFYNDLPPRHYRFRVMASNNSGVWNEAGAWIDFSIAPKFYQTGWFLASSVAAVLAMVWGAYRLLLLYLTQRFNMRLEGRVSERTRIARDLHDTLLQSFQGVLLKFHSVTYLLPDHPAEARTTLESAIEQARDAITEGRNAVEGLRSSTVVTEDIAHAISRFGEGLAVDQASGDAPRFHVYEEGVPRKLAPVLRDEIYRIATEALRNAFRHAAARRIEVDIHYDKRQLRLRVRDDGKGIDPQVLREGARAAHHGLPGMHERAKLAGGKLAVWSELDSGTEVELTISAALVYAKAPAARQPISSGQAGG